MERNLRAGAAWALRAFVAAILLGLSIAAAQAHDWFPRDCCSGHDCRVIGPDDVSLTPAGFLIKESGETIAYNSPLLRRTPPEGGGQYARCSHDGKPEAATICLYIPNWGS